VREEKHLLREATATLVGNAAGNLNTELLFTARKREKVQASLA